MMNANFSVIQPTRDDHRSTNLSSYLQAASNSKSVRSEVKPSLQVNTEKRIRRPGAADLFIHCDRVQSPTHCPHADPFEVGKIKDWIFQEMVNGSRGTMSIDNLTAAEIDDTEYDPPPYFIGCLLHSNDHTSVS